MLSRLLEKSFELKIQDYEKQIWSLKEEIKALRDEKMQLQRQVEEERITSDGLKGEVARLSKQAQVEAASHFSMSSLAESIHPHVGSSFSFPRITRLKARGERALVPPVLPSTNPQLPLS